MIQVCDLAKRYGPVTAVDGLTIDVRPGRVTGFLGPNGSGPFRSPAPASPEETP